MSEITKQLTGPDLALIKEYASPWDRQSPPVFVGRHDEIGLVEKNCHRALARFQQGKKTGGHIIVLRGAPGAGKSSLLEHVAERWTEETDPLVISIPRKNLKNTGAVVWKIGEHVFPSEAKKLDEKTVSTTRGRLGAWLFDLEKSKTSTTGSAPIDFSVLAKLKPGNQWERPVCLLVDEIQKVTEEHGECLSELQLGEHGLPIVLVCAGLANAAEKMQEAMSPRLTTGNLRTLGALPPDEVHFCIEQMFEQCRIPCTADQLERIGGRIAKDSEGWPQHVRTETAALFGELAETRGDLELVDSRAVKQRADNYRKISYRARRSQEMGSARRLVASVLKMIPEGGAPADHVVDIIEAKADQTGQKSWRLPKGMDAEDFLDHLIHQGIFQPDETGLLSCPIPSLRSWLIKQADATNQENAVPESLPSAPENRDVLETSVKQAAEQFETDLKRRAAPDRDRGAERYNRRSRRRFARKSRRFPARESRDSGNSKPPLQKHRVREISGGSARPRNP